MNILSIFLSVVVGGLLGCQPFPSTKTPYLVDERGLDGRKDAAGNVFDGEAIYINNVMGDGFIGGAALG